MRTFIIADPTYYTKLRMREVQFALIIHMLLEEDKDVSNIKNLVEDLCVLSGARITNIHYAINELFTLKGKPKHLEYALMNKHIEIPFRTICTTFKKSNRKMYEELEKYVEEGGETLKPILHKEIHEDLEKFNLYIIRVFGKMANILKEGKIYDKRESIRFL